MLHSELTGKIIQAFYKVNNTSGFGFLEKVYENAMCIELKKVGLKVRQQKNIKVYYGSEEIGDYFADLLVKDIIIVELKAAESLCHDHELQLHNYLKAKKIEIGLLLNSGKKSEFRRKIYTNDKK